MNSDLFNKIYNELDLLWEKNSILSNFVELPQALNFNNVKSNYIKSAKKFYNWKLARSKTEAAFLLKEGINCIWCPTDLYKFSKNEGFINKEFALSMACQLTKGLLMRRIYLFRQDELSDVLTEGIHNMGVTVEYC